MGYNSVVENIALSSSV